MKASELLALVKESSKGTKSVEGEVKTPSYDNMHTPDNHVAGKGTKEVTNAHKDFGKKRDKRNPANPGKPKKGEKRGMEGPGKSYKRMSEAAPGARPEGAPTAEKNLQTAQHIVFRSVQDLDVAKGHMVIAPDRMTARQLGIQPGKPIQIQMDPQDLGAMLKPAVASIKRAQNAGDVFSVWTKFVADVQSGTGAKRTAPSGRKDTAPNVYKGATPQAPQWGLQDSADDPQPDEPWHNDPSLEVGGRKEDKPRHYHDDDEEYVRRRELARAKAGLSMYRESYADSNSMAEKQPVKHRGAVSKTAKVRGKVNDEPENKADPGKPKNDGKSVMGPGASPEKAKEVTEGLKDLEKLLGRKLKIK